MTEQEIREKSLLAQRDFEEKQKQLELFALSHNSVKSSEQAIYFEIDCSSDYPIKTAGILLKSDILTLTNYFVIEYCECSLPKMEIHAV
ncbi:MAG: hypothetical protein IJ748_05765 [Bacteroidales bacterium]|nr:hypothetical protein [Bacteroidales bacterium]